MCVAAFLSDDILSLSLCFFSNVYIVCGAFVFDEHFVFSWKKGETGRKVDGMSLVMMIDWVCI